jgi:hypothetical protein
MWILYRDKNPTKLRTMALKTYLNPRIDLIIRLGGFKAEYCENPTLLHDGWLGGY